MREVPGVGAVKLERFGPEFLAVILGEAPATVHPARRRLAGSEGGPLFDRLEAAQRDLARGPDGAAKPLACDARTLARIAEARPANLAALARVPGMDARRVERFGAAFLAALREADAA